MSFNSPFSSKKNITQTCLIVNTFQYRITQYHQRIYWEPRCESYNYMDASKNMGTPNHPSKNRRFHYFHHPFWDTFIFGNTQMVRFCECWSWRKRTETTFGTLWVVDPKLGKCRHFRNDRNYQVLLFWRVVFCWSEKKRHCNGQLCNCFCSSLKTSGSMQTDCSVWRCFDVTYGESTQTSPVL